MTSVLLHETPAVLQEWLDRRRELGQDGFDEVWEGVYHVSPMAHGRQGWMDEELSAALRASARSAGLRGSGPVNIGSPGDYRVPGRSYFRTRRTELWNPTAAIVVEVISPNDESRLKFDFYFRVGVEELLLVDPLERTVEWFVRDSGGFGEVEGSVLLGLSAAELHGAIDWPE